jgi:hypothetical protein
MFWRTTMLAGIIMIATAALLVSGCKKEKTYLDDGGFESYSSLQKTPTGWGCTELPATSDLVDFVWDSDTHYRGKRSISIKIDESHPNERIAYNWYATVQNWEVGKHYELSCWVKTQDLKGPAWVCVQCWDESNTEMVNFATTQKDYPITGTSDWQQVGTVFAVPDGTHRVLVRAGIATPDNRGGQVWFDELHVRQVD